MNDRERFLETMCFGSPDRIPYWECAFWGETLSRWVDEGMPEEVLHPDGPESRPTEGSLRGYFGFDRSFGVYFRGTVPADLNGFRPTFETKTLSEEDGIVTQVTATGMTVRKSKSDPLTTQFVRFPVETRADFQEIRKRMDPTDPARHPEGWKEKALARQESGAPVCLSVGGYYGFARSLMGMEGLSVAFYDQPELVEEIFEFRTESVLTIIEKVLEEVTPDLAEFWEDMAYKTGPLVSPELYRKLSLKHYRRVTDVLRRHGVKVILLDSDGNVDSLIPIWLDSGINCIWPLEAAAGTDPVALRKRYGGSLGLIGGIDKRALARGPAAIDREVHGKIPYLIESGGFIPTCDHAVPHDVSLANYQYYLEQVRKLAESG